MKSSGYSNIAMWADLAYKITHPFPFNCFLDRKIYNYIHDSSNHYSTSHSLINSFRSHVLKQIQFISYMFNMLLDFIILTLDAQVMRNCQHC